MTAFDLENQVVSDDTVRNEPSPVQEFRACEAALISREPWRTALVGKAVKCDDIDLVFRTTYQSAQGESLVQIRPTYAHIYLWKGWLKKLTFRV